MRRRIAGPSSGTCLRYQIEENAAVRNRPLEVYSERVPSGLLSKPLQWVKGHT